MLTVALLRFRFLTIDLFRYMLSARAPMTWVASKMNNVVLSGGSARMTYEVSAAENRHNPPFYRHSRRHAEGMASFAASMPRGESHLQTNKMGQDSRNGEATQRCGGSDTRRFPPVYRREWGWLRRFCHHRCFVRHCLCVIRANSPLKTACFILLATQVIGAWRADSHFRS